QRELMRRFQVAVVVTITAMFSAASMASSGSISSLGTLGGYSSWAFAVNGSGTITGMADDSTNGYRKIFQYSHGQMNNLGTLPDGYYSVGLGINSTGTIVGYSSYNGPGIH